MKHPTISLVFIPHPTISHMMATVQTAKVIADRDDRLSAYSHINFLQLTKNQQNRPPKYLMGSLIDRYSASIKAAVAEMRQSTRFGGFILDILCFSVIDLTKKLGVPAYLSYTSGAASLGLMLHLQSLHHGGDSDLAEYEELEMVLPIPAYMNLVPARVWPSIMFRKETGFVDLVRRLREAKGIILNTFLEFESHTVRYIDMHR